MNLDFLIIFLRILCLLVCSLITSTPAKYYLFDLNLHHYYYSFNINFKNVLELCIAGVDANNFEPNLLEPEKDFGILWAVPKSRRTVEKRRMRKYGWPDHVWKPLVPKNNLIPCTTCGSSHEAGYLCRKYLLLSYD